VLNEAQYETEQNVTRVKLYSDLRASILYSITVNIKLKFLNTTDCLKQETKAN
jgi:hypothetical protein